MNNVRFLSYLLAAMVLALPVACGPSPQSRTAATLNDVESYINERPDSALAVLRSLDSTAAYRGPAQRARAALLHSMALDKSSIDLQTDSVLAPAIAWYEHHGSPDEKLKTLYYLGRLQFNAKDYQKAIVTYTEALDLTEKATDLKYIGFVNQAIADTYAVSYQEGESYPYLDRAFQSFLAVPDSALAKLTLYKQALTDVTQQKWNRADSLYKLLLEDPRGLERFLFRIQSDYALSLILQSDNNVSKATKVFREALSQGNGLPSANHWAAYAYCLSANECDLQSDTIYHKIDSLYPSDKTISYWRNKTEFERGEFGSAYRLLQESFVYQDSVLRNTLSQSTITAQKDYFAYRAAEEKNLAQHRKDTILLILLSVLLVTILVFSSVDQHMRKERHERIRLMQMMETIKTQSEKVEREKTQQYRYLFQDYFNTLGQICADYEEGKINAGSSADKAILRRIDRIVHDFVGDAGSHNAFEELLDKHLNNIMTAFRKDFPKMRPQDYLLVSYVFAGIDMPTMSVLMGVDVDALYTRKSRLKATIQKSSSRDKTRYLGFFR